VEVDRVDPWESPKPFDGSRILGHDDRASLGTIPAHELGGRSDVDDAPAVDDRHAVSDIKMPRRRLPPTP